MIVNIPLPLLLLLIAWGCLMPVILGGLIWLQYHVQQKADHTKTRLLDWITDEIFTEMRIRMRRGF